MGYVSAVSVPQPRAASAPDSAGSRRSLGAGLL
ncbi:TIGR02234 family membrane protein, partial [[Kitasatospora] papulosa]